MFECDKGDCWEISGITKGCQSLQYLHILTSDNLNAANYPFHLAPKNYFAKHFSHTLCDLETFHAYIKQLTKLLFCRSLNYGKMRRFSSSHFSPSRVFPCYAIPTDLTVKKVSCPLLFTRLATV